MQLAEECYLLTKTFPSSEMYGMTAQIRRSAVSVAANVAEGHGREHTRSFVHFLRIAQGSLKEVETHLMISGRVGLAHADRLNPVLARAEEVGKMLRGLIRSLQRRMEGGGA